MLKRIHIKGFKSLADVDLRLQPLSVLIGANASGKSNLLDALRFLSKAATSETLGEAFEPAHRGLPIELFTMRPGGIEEMARSERLRFSIEADMQLSDAVVDAANEQVREVHRITSGAFQPEKEPALVQERYLRYRMDIEMLPQSAELRIASEYLAALDAQGKPIKGQEPFIERQGNEMHLHLEGRSRLHREDVPLHRAALSMQLYPPHHPHIMAAQRELRGWQCFDFEPHERMRKPSALGQFHRIGPRGEDIAGFLHTLKTTAPKRFKSIEKSLRLMVANVDGIEVDVNNYGDVELCVKQNGIAMSARVLSGGTLRMLGMLCLVAYKDVPTLVGLKEPENGIHPRRMQLIAELLKTQEYIGQTQYIVTTQSPILPDWVSREHLFVVGQDDGQTFIDPLSAWGPIWRKKETDRIVYDDDYEELPVSGRLLRGDFGA